MEQRRVRSALVGFMHEDDLHEDRSRSSGQSWEDELTQSLKSQGMTVDYARSVVLKVREQMRGPLSIAIGEVVDVIGQASWEKVGEAFWDKAGNAHWERAGNDALLVVRSQSGVYARVRSSEIDLI